ncbi:phage holin family protein [Streptomyces ficellus]|uniref:Phage holin family protein n=1 Tax=Streptomyces ficellus TaxID=1977088 RepID=A0ABT7Z2I2_9ACTN|nr:phage holin family protein [Streptomyces ficellus]MDN3293321.1 phage holin family protein [Streptomyces ficellus]
MQSSPQDMSTVVREEMDNARQEAALGLSEARRGAVALAAGGACGLLALWSAHTTLLRHLERAWEPQRVTGVLTVVYASGASALVRYGSRKLGVARSASGEALHSSLDVVRHVADELRDG